jgi:hypothetical protein
MKKLLIVLAISAFAACNSGSESTTTDSTAVDTSTMAPMDTSSSMMADTSNMMMSDTTHKDSMK